MNNKQQELFEKALLTFPENILNKNASEEILLVDFFEREDFNLFKNMNFQNGTEWFTLDYILRTHENDNNNNPILLQQITHASFFKQCIFPLFCINTIILKKMTDLPDYFCKMNMLRQIPDISLKKTIEYDIVFFIFLHLNIIEELLPPPPTKNAKKKVQEIKSIPTFKGKQYIHLIRKKIFFYFFENNIEPTKLKKIFIRLINHYGNYKNETLNLAMPFSAYVENIKNKKLNHMLEKYFFNLIFFSSRINKAYTEYYNNQSK